MILEEDSVAPKLRRSPRPPLKSQNSGQTAEECLQEHNSRQRVVAALSVQQSDLEKAADLVGAGPALRFAIEQLVPFAVLGKLCLLGCREHDGKLYPWAALWKASC